MKKSRSDQIFDIINILFMLVTIIIMLYPLYFVVIASFSEPYDVAKGNVTLLPSGFTLDAYKNVFKEPQIWIGYRNTIFYTILGTAWNLITLIPAAYVMSKKKLCGRTFLSWFFFITMYFGGGMVPTYLLMKDLNLLNTPWIMILGSVSCYNLIVTRTFFSNSIPDSLYEAAYIDGASEFRTFFRVALPLSGSIIAVMALFHGVGHWNSFYNALLYIHDKNLYPLQLVLRNILIQNQSMVMEMLENSDTEAAMHIAQQAYMAEAMKYALIFIASAPLLIAYPFVQKYFVKGVMIGSMKG